MRKWMSVLITLLYTMVIVSCGNDKKTQGSEVQYTGSQNEKSVGNVQESESDILEEKTELEVYYLKEDISATTIISNYKAANSGVSVNVKAFSSVEEMDNQIAVVAGADKGPDVILFPKTTNLDWFKMSKGDVFMDLTDYIESDDTFLENNYYSVLEAGKINDRQMLMPLRMQCVYYLTSEEKMVEAQLELPEQYTVTEMFEALTKNAETRGDDTSAIQSLYAQTNGGILYDNLRLSGVEVIEPEKAELSVPEDIFKEYADFAQVTHEQLEKSSVILEAYSRDFIGAIARLTTMMSNTSLAFNMRYYEAIFREGVNQKLQVLPLPNFNNSETITVDISLYAAVMKHTDQPQLAYEFLRFALDSPVKNPQHDLPISKEALSGLLDTMEDVPGKKISIGSASVTIPRLSEEVRADCEMILERISSGSIRNRSIEAIITESMEPYILGEADFDSCYTKFKNQVEIYLYE